MSDVVQAGVISYLAEHWEVFVWIVLNVIVMDILKRKTHLSKAIFPVVSGIITTVVFYIGCQIFAPEQWDKFVFFWTLGRH